VGTDFTSTKSSTWSGIKRGMKRGIFMLIPLIFILSGIFIYGKYFSNSGDGYRTGLLQKFSHEGNLIKTYEGEIVLSNVTGNTNIPPVTEKFYFSVTSKTLANQLDTIQGQMVTVHYQQKNAPLFWQGESVFLVDDVKRTP
jgi:hypothetical protein